LPVSHGSTYTLSPAGVSKRKAACPSQVSDPATTGRLLELRPEKAAGGAGNEFLAVVAPAADVVRRAEDEPTEVIAGPPSLDENELAGPEVVPEVVRQPADPVVGPNARVGKRLGERRPCGAAVQLDLARYGAPDGALTGCPAAMASI
jgi:hypothetical protein